MRWLAVVLLLTACSGATSDPVATEPLTTKPLTTEPLTTEPLTTEPATTEPLTTEPATTEPATASEASIPALDAVDAVTDGSEVRPEGFASTAARTTMSDGTVCEVCLWIAEAPADRARGLMSVTDLGAADGMAFVYPDAHSGSFWMKNTILPLSIAFYSPTGEFLDAFDMEPCTGEPCASYPTPAGFLVAVEVPQAGLDELGLVAGSTLELLDLPCDDS